MEWAIFIAKSSELKNWSDKYSRIYFGNEFCQKLIPDVEETERVLDFVLSNNLNFTLVTSYVTDAGADRLRVLLRIISQRSPRTEVVINDWGMLDVVKEYDLKPIIGRLLIKQKRDPRITNLMGKLPKPMAECSKYASIDFYLSKFLKSKGIERIEIDNLLQGLELDKAKTSSLLFSLYFPYGYVTTSRWCLFNGSNNIQDREFESQCQNKCNGKVIGLRHASVPVPLYIKGNTVFFKNVRPPVCIERKEIDRLIYQANIDI